ncbi:MAG: alpha/beta hydrolase [Bacteriovoracaceae bacterium]
MQKNTIEIKGKTLSFLTKNEGPEKALLFVHGNSLSKDIFQSQIESLAKTGAYCIAVDLPGHGESSKRLENESYSLDYYAETLKDFCSILGLQKITFFGHSLAGHIGSHLFQKKPDLFEALITLATPPVSDVDSMGKAFHPHEALPSLVTGDLSSEQVEFLAKACLDSEMHVKEVSEMIVKTDPRTRDELGKSLVSGNFQNEIEILKNSNIAYLNIFSANDEIVSSEYIKSLPIFSLKNQKVTEVQSSHNAILEDPDKVKVIIEDFLNGVGLSL